MLTFIYITIETILLLALTISLLAKTKKLEKGYVVSARNTELKFEDAQMREILSNIYVGEQKIALKLNKKGQLTY